MQLSSLSIKTKLNYFRQEQLHTKHAARRYQTSQINLSWTDITTAGLLPVLQNMKTGNDGVCRKPMHTQYSAPPTHRADSLARRRSIRAAPKASDAAEHTEQVCSRRPRPSFSKRFRCPTVGPVCSCIKSVLVCWCSSSRWASTHTWASPSRCCWRPDECLIREALNWFNGN